MGKRKPMSQGEHDRTEGMTPGWKLDRAAGDLPMDTEEWDAMERRAAEQLTGQGPEERGVTKEVDERIGLFTELTGAKLAANAKIEGEVFSFIDTHPDALRGNLLIRQFRLLQKPKEGLSERSLEAHNPIEKLEILVRLDMLLAIEGLILDQLREQIRNTI